MNDPEKVSMHRKLKLIVAMCQNRGIGNNNSIPWKIKKDLIISELSLLSALLLMTLMF